MKKKILPILLVLCVFTFVSCNSKGKNDNSNVNTEKDVSVEIVWQDGERNEYEVNTDAEYLAQVLDEIDELSYETDDGMVMVINGVRADYVKDGAYWAFFVNGEYCNYGISDQPVADGDEFEIVYTVAQ